LIEFTTEAKSSRAGKSCRGYVSNMEKLTTVLINIKYTVCDLSSSNLSSKNAVTLPLDTGPNATTEKHATVAKMQATVSMLHVKAALKSSGCLMALSTGRIRQIPSKEYKIAHSDNGVLEMSRDGVTLCPELHSIQPIVAKQANPAIISSVPTIITGAKCFKVGRKLNNMTGGVARESS
jgi:hypothetical protein